jgi:hypothetical protein
MTTTAADVRRAAARALTASERARDTTELLYVAIVRAYENGIPVADIAQAASLTRARIYQILDANKKPSDPLPTVTP